MHVADRLNLFPHVVSNGVTTGAAESILTMRRGSEMRKTFPSITIVALVAAIAAGGCSGSEIEVQSKWADSPVVVDGNPEDWAGFPMEYFEEAKVSVGLRNDEENLYIMLRFRDEPPANFLQHKVTLWLDKTGKKEKTFGISYGGGMRFSQRPRQQDGFFGSLTSEQKEEFRRRQAEMQKMITVLHKDTSVSIVAKGEQGVIVARTYQQGFYCHEMAIPLQTKDAVSYAIGAAAGEAISAGVEMGVSAEDRNRMMEERRSRPAGGEPGGGMAGGGRPPGGMPGGGRPGAGMRGGGRQMPEKQEMWLTVTLASKPNE